MKCNKKEAPGTQGMLGERLKSYIQAELNDSALYAALAEKTDKCEEQKLLREISCDEQRHAEEFSDYLRSRYGESVCGCAEAPELCGKFEDIALDRIIDESNDYRKYSREYMSSCDPRLKKLFFGAMTDENVHAHRLMYIVHKNK